MSELKRWRNRRLKAASEAKTTLLRQILATIDESNVACEFTGEKATSILKLFTMTVIADIPSHP